MTEDFNFDRSRAGGGGTDEFFEPRAQQGHLFIIRVFDCVFPVRTKHAPTGYVTRNGQTYPNNAVRAAIVDMNQYDDTGALGKLYSEAMIFTGLLVKELKKDIGKTILITWHQQDPTDKSSPYRITEMAGNEQATAAARDYLVRHPEFMQIPAPAEWKIEMSPPVQEPQWNQQQQWNPGYGPPQQQNWQPGYGQPSPQWQQPQQPSPPQYGPSQPQWQPPSPNYGPPQQQGWGQDQGYNQHPPRQQNPGGWQQPPAPTGPPQGAPGTFLEAYSQQRGQSQNHWGQPQNEEPPY